MQQASRQVGSGMGLTFDLTAHFLSSFLKAGCVNSFALVHVLLKAEMSVRHNAVQVILARM